MAFRRIPEGVSAVASSSEPRPVRVPLAGAALVVAVAVVLGFLVYSAQFSGSLQWGLGLLGLAILAAYAWRQVLRGTSEPDPLVDPAAPEAFRSGEFGVFSRAVRRAARGLPFSQVMVTSRARAGFLEHAGLARGMPAETMRTAQSDPVALRRLIGDDVLVEFLQLRTGDLDESYGWVLKARARGGFNREFRDVLTRMEAWR